MTNSSNTQVQIGVVRTMPHFSMDVYADGLISGFQTVCPSWQVVELAPNSVDRRSRSTAIRLQKTYERFWQFPRRVQQQPADIYHIIDHSDAHIIRWIKRKGKPVVVTCHDLINYFYPQNLEGSVRLPLVSDRLWRSAVKTMAEADAIVAVSTMTANDIKKILNIDAERIFVVPNAVDDIFQPASSDAIQSFRQHMSTPPGTLCLLNVGSNHPRKNVLIILQALNHLKQSGIPVHFWKINGAFNSEQQAFIQAHRLEESIRYLENLDKSALIQAYSAADVLVAPSLHEGVGLTLLEAMACGTPVITSNCSAMPEVVGDAGVLVDPTDSQAIANAVQYLYQNQASYQELCLKSIERSQLFSWKKTAAKITKVYATLLS